MTNTSGVEVSVGVVNTPAGTELVTVTKFPPENTICSESRVTPVLTPGLTVLMASGSHVGPPWGIPFLTVGYSTVVLAPITFVVPATLKTPAFEKEAFEISGWAFETETVEEDC